MLGTIRTFCMNETLCERAGARFSGACTHLGGGTLRREGTGRSTAGLPGFCTTKSSGGDEALRSGGDRAGTRVSATSRQDAYEASRVRASQLRQYAQTWKFLDQLM